MGRIKKLNDIAVKSEHGQSQREVPPSAVKQHQDVSTESVQKSSYNIFKNTASANKEVASDLEFLKNPTSLFASMIPKDMGINIFSRTSNTINLFTAQPMGLEQKQELPPTNINVLVGLATDDGTEDECISVTQQSPSK